MLLHVTLQQDFKIKNCTANFARKLQCLVVLFSVLLQHHGRSKNDIATAESALDLARNLRQMQIFVGF
jgi:hypothetical protein